MLDIDTLKKIFKDLDESPISDQLLIDSMVLAWDTHCEKEVKDESKIKH